VKLDLNVTRGGVDSVVTTRPVDLVAWERETGRSLSQLGDDTRFSDMALIAYFASTRGQTPRPSFDDWLIDLDAVELGAVDSGSPTPPAR
jgi:hypothetical protein